MTHERTSLLVEKRAIERALGSIRVALLERGPSKHGAADLFHALSIAGEARALKRWTRAAHKH